MNVAEEQILKLQSGTWCRGATDLPKDSGTYWIINGHARLVRAEFTRYDGGLHGWKDPHGMMQPSGYVFLWLNDKGPGFNYQDVQHHVCEIPENSTVCTICGS